MPKFFLFSYKNIVAIKNVGTAINWLTKLKYLQINEKLSEFIFAQNSMPNNTRVMGTTIFSLLKIVFCFILNTSARVILNALNAVSPVVIGKTTTASVTTITNTGDTKGREVVQIYGQSPYTEYDKKHGVEKSAVILCGYDKTKILKPGESETVKIAVDKRDFASFDTYGEGTYIMDAGNYYITIATDSHKAINQILAKT